MLSFGKHCVQAVLCNNVLATVIQAVVFHDQSLFGIHADRGSSAAFKPVVKKLFVLSHGMFAGNNRQVILLLSPQQRAWLYLLL
jgi:hypothetical protein